MRTVLLNTWQCAATVTHGIVTQQDVKDSDVTMERFVWDRMDVHERLFDDRSVIVGHTPTLFFRRHIPILFGQIPVM